MRSWVHHHGGWFNDSKNLFFLYVTETGGNRDTIRDDGRIYDDLLNQLWAEWDHLKNGPHKTETKNWDLLWVSPKAGKRESRRFLGDVVVTQTNLEEGKFWPDDIAWGGHDLDDHRPLGDGSDIFAHSVPPLYGIPFRACYSRNVPNLLLGGRLISATHLAHSSCRVMRTGGAIGQAIGYAAALCCRYDCGPRDVAEQHITELRAGLFEVDASIPPIASFQVDGDLASAAQITATSELRFNDQDPVQSVPLIAPAGAVFWNWPTTLSALECWLCNTTAAVQPLTLRVLRAVRTSKWKSMTDFHDHGRNDLRDEAFAEVFAMQSELPGDHQGWCRFELPEPLALHPKDPTCDDDRLIVGLTGPPSVQWGVIDGACDVCDMIEHSHHADRWQLVGARPALRLTPEPSWGEATNVVNGIKQRFGRAPTNMWMSNPEDGFPQDLILTWSDPREFGEITVVFDNLTVNRHEYPWEHGPRVLPHLVKAYELAWFDDGDWRTLVEETCNIHRFRVHRFAAATSSCLRLRVLETHGPGQGAGVYELRVRR